MLKYKKKYIYINTSSSIDSKETEKLKVDFQFPVSHVRNLVVTTPSYQQVNLEQTEKTIALAYIRWELKASCCMQDWRDRGEYRELKLNPTETQ